MKKFISSLLLVIGFIVLVIVGCGFVTHITVKLFQLGWKLVI